MFLLLMNDQMWIPFISTIQPLQKEAALCEIPPFLVESVLHFRICLADFYVIITLFMRVTSKGKENRNYKWKFSRIKWEVAAQIAEEET